MQIVATAALFVVTAIAEIIGCYLPYLVLRHQASFWLLLPAALSLAVFAWLLTLHPFVAAGRIYAAYGGVYVATAMMWLWLIEGQQPRLTDFVGSFVAIFGMTIIVIGAYSQR